MIFLWLIVPVMILLAIGLGLSFYMTRRHHLAFTHTPEEYSLPGKEVAFAAADGLLLRGYWIPAPGSDRAVIILHGHSGSLDYDLYRAQPLYAAGFNVLLFDFRAHGRSAGRITTFGFLERWDVLGAVQFLQGMGIRRIGLLGFSLGGISAILSAAICPEIDAVISDGSPARMRSSLTAWGEERGVPGWIARFLALLMLVATSLRLGASQFRYEPVRWVSQLAPRPILFIHGDQDQYCPDFDALYAAARQPKELWRVPEAGHTKISQLYPEQFEQHILDFFNRYLSVAHPDT